ARVSIIQLNDGSSQRSMVTSLKITFDSPVSFVGSPAAAFSLVNQSASNSANVAAAVDGSGTEVTLTFTGGSIDLGGSLSDGRYTLTIVASEFTGNGFDGNSDVIPGDKYVLASAAAPNPPTNIFRFFGDLDGDGDVDASNFLTFRNMFLGITPYDPAFDFDGSGSVDAADFLQFRNRFLLGGV